MTERDGKIYDAYELPFTNLYDTLEATARNFPNKTAVIDARRNISYSALKRETVALASYLKYGLGLGPGCTVAMMLVNNIEFCIAFYAILKIGATIASVSTKSSTDEVKFIVSDSRACALICDALWITRIPDPAETECLKYRIYCNRSTAKTKTAATKDSPDKIATKEGTGRANG